MQHSAVQDVEKWLRNLVNIRMGAMMLPVSSVSDRQQTLHWDIVKEAS
jgi:hypothetical protein